MRNSIKLGRVAPLLTDPTCATFNPLPNTSSSQPQILQLCYMLYGAIPPPPKKMDYILLGWVTFWESFAVLAS